MNVTDKMAEAGRQIASELMTAQVAYNMDGLGGSMYYEEWLEKPTKNRDLIMQYLLDEIDSVTAIYLAMEREKV